MDHKVSAAKISSLRVILGRNQAELARIFGVSVSTVSRWEAADSTIEPLQLSILSALEEVLAGPGRGALLASLRAPKKTGLYELYLVLRAFYASGCHDSTRS